MNRQEANKQILDMYNDSTYQELKAYYEKTTIFNVLGVERSETRHSAFLCWLLNANASHGLGEEPMKKLLRLYATKMDDDSSFRIMLMTGDYELEMNDIVTEKSTSDEQGSKGGKSKKKDRMDVWATMTLKDMAGNEQSLALVIENKIYKQELLAGLWHSNEDLFKVIISVLKEYPEQMMLSPDVYDNVFKETNRDTTKYNVICDGTYVGWHLNQAQTALHVFRAYLQKTPDASLDDLRKAFPRELNNYSYFQNLLYLFYPAAADNPDWDCGKLEGQRGTGDFYTNEKDLLVVRGERIMCVKWWKKTDGSFQQLIEHVRQNFPYIQIEEY